MSEPTDLPIQPTGNADVVDITVDRPSMELRLTFDDGVSGSIGLVDLRLHCPCATCRVARQAGRPAWPVRSGEQVLELRDAQLVGAWGLGVVWNDGHATGIYPFSALHEWIRQGYPPLSPDSGLGA